MKLTSLALTAGLLVGLAATAHAKIERSVEKTFSVAPGGTLSVSTFGGDIRVEPGAGNEVKVVARQVLPRARSEAEADDILKELSLEITQDAADVSVQARYEKGWKGFGWRGTPVQVHVTVTVPSRYHVDLKTSGGDIRVGDITGKARVRTSGGDIGLARIDGVIDATTSGGDIKLTEGTAETKLTTSGGDIEVGKVSGPATLTTSGGDIRADAVAGVLHASTSGGDVSAGFTGPLAGDVSLSSSGGDITARLAKNSAAKLDASTSGGDVRAGGVTIEIESGGLGKSRLAGSINGGGPLLKLRTSGGNITVAVR